jgi:hypothetical protein
MSDPVSRGIASVAHGRIVDRLVPINLTASTCASDFVGTRVDLSFDPMPQSAVEQRIFGKTRATGVSTPAGVTGQVDRATTCLNQ